jgi:hypothetical protein
MSFKNASQALANSLRYTAVTQATRTNLFEVIQINPDDLARHTGRFEFNSTEELPANLLQVIKQVYAADAILFTDITHYDAYQPIKMGIRSKLIKLSDSQAIWAFDDYFDTGDPRITAAALHFEENNNKQAYPYKKESIILQSPNQFSAFVFATAYATMPQRHRPLPMVPEGYPRSTVEGTHKRDRPSLSTGTKIPQIK